jgi:hypothetical protein
MERYRGNLRKMNAVLNGDQVKYTLNLGDHALNMNSLIGQTISITYQNRINCIKCNRETKKSFAQGYCYPCFISVPETESCVLRPELCQAHEGIARDMVFAKNNCLIDHYVYLAISSGLKVGVTRHTQVPVRWLDQGASYALILAKTPNRFMAGQIEVALKTLYADKSNWRKLLTADGPDLDLLQEKGKIEELLPFDLRQYITDDDYIYRIKYPLSEYPVKVTPVNLDKGQVVQDELLGIKGQYLLFRGGKVINIRKYNGYLVDIQTG